MDFEISDYNLARSYAKKIKNHAENIKEILDEVSKNMKVLTDSAYRSTGADNTYMRYQVLASKYDTFYRLVVELHDAINTVSEQDETADKKVSSTLEEALDETISHIA